MAGYSGTPLLKKLGIKPGHSLCVLGAPMDYAQLLGGLPEGVSLSARIRPEADCVHLFETRRAGLAGHLKTLAKMLKPKGMVWVSWPKKSSGVPSEILEDTVRELALPLGLVDVKVCAVDETWSGLKLVWRLENRK
jgi:hypothetical protein